MSILKDGRLAKEMTVMYVTTEKVTSVLNSNSLPLLTAHFA